MTDPISPTGSLGQVPLVAAASIASSAKTTGVPNAAALQASSQATSKGAGPAVRNQAAGAASGVQDKAHDEDSRTDPLSPKTPSKETTPPPTVEEAARSFQEYLKNLPSDLQFRQDKESGIVTFKVVNPLTQEVIRQYPPEEVVEMARWIKRQNAQQGSGIFLDEQL